MSFGYLSRALSALLLSVTLMFGPAALADSTPSPTPPAVQPVPTKYTFTRAYPQPPIYDQGSVPSCVGWAFATTLSALAEVETGKTVRFDGDAIYRPIALDVPGGGAYVGDAVNELETTGALGSDGKVWKITSAERIQVTDRAAVEQALIDHKVLVLATGLTYVFDEERVAHYYPEAQVTGYHAAMLLGYHKHTVVWQSSWGTHMAHHHKGRWRTTWAYLEHYSQEVVAIDIAPSV